MQRRFRRAWEESNLAARGPALDLSPRQRTTLEIGSSAVLGMLAAGLQLGNWSLWSVPVALTGYYVWVIAYSEATVRAARRDRRASA